MSNNCKKDSQASRTRAQGERKAFEPSSEEAFEGWPVTETERYFCVLPVLEGFLTMTMEDLELR